MLGYISRGFVAIVMKRPGLPWPLKGLPALNDLGAERRGSGAEPGCGPPPLLPTGEETTGRACHWLVYLHSSCLSARPVVLYFFFFVSI